MGVTTSLSFRTSSRFLWSRMWVSVAQEIERSRAKTPVYSPRHALRMELPLVAIKRTGRRSTSRQPGSLWSRRVGRGRGVQRCQFPGIGVTLHVTGLRDGNGPEVTSAQVRFFRAGASEAASHGSASKAFRTLSENRSWRRILPIHENPIRCLLPSQAFRRDLLVRSVLGRFFMCRIEPSAESLETNLPPVQFHLLRRI